ncbi:hypothetical protein LEP1GSC186_0301 [Leptospira noguchii serovar Autumnalis str. ZUN142]|uniref:Uncharacterized protein n=1 Tax=Leptospira noguchii serovar Autumnalis str. ZUN142 TaxID=1085540 RepID=M6UDB8_9LEPT|nr:hypothetical protein LEP1GSC072_2190 [Leptospira noguchii str. Bonito]EMO39069.1 hypothetical protein LEP1GSC186_0301 [Leptospira noguchii serovar Autumnalis str. ZUN142]
MKKRVAFHLFQAHFSTVRPSAMVKNYLNQKKPKSILLRGFFQLAHIRGLRDRNAVV